MARIKGNALTIEIDSVEYKTHLTSVLLEQAEADSKFVTFADAAAGGSYEWTMKGTASQDDAEDSFWNMVWDNTGTEVDFVMARAGNAVATATQPHFTGTVKIGVKPAIGGDAGEDVWSFDFEWKVVGEVIKKITA